ncbi:MAG: AMP-binding protein [Actinomycetota bacterium]
MIEGALQGLRQMAQYASPTTMKRLREAGASHPMGLVALARSLPWLLGRGPSLGVVSRMNSIVLGDKPAIHDRSGALTWKELEERANRAAHLLQEAGVAGGDRIAMVLRNGREMIEIALAAQKLGIIACPMNTWAKPKELEAMLSGSAPSLLVYDTLHTEQLQGIARDLELIAVGDADAALDGSLLYEPALAEQPGTPPIPFTRNPGSAKVVIHTSGTTGTPKGAQRDSSAAGIGALANLLAVVPYRRDDVVLCPAPLFHSFGLATFTIAIALGSTMVLPEKFDAEESLELIQRHRVTAASFVPVMIRRIVSLPEDVKDRYDPSSLRVVMASGSALSEDLRRAAAELFGPVLYDLYGSTEVGWVTIATPEDMSTRPKAVGKPVPGIDIAVFSEDGERLPPGELGEIFVKSEVLFQGYTSGESKKVVGDYMTIGDVGRLDDDGYLFIEGRADDMVVVGGENIYPVEIEGVIEDIDGVDEVAVLGVADDEYGEVLAAFVVGSADPEQIKKVCEQELASFKVPRRIEIRDELPRTSTGKVIKRELIERAGT